MIDSLDLAIMAALNLARDLVAERAANQGGVAQRRTRARAHRARRGPAARRGTAAPAESAAASSDAVALDAAKSRLRAAMTSAAATRSRATSATRRGAAVARIACALAEFAARAIASLPTSRSSDEVPTRAILDAVLASGRVLLLPRVVASGLEFAAVEDLARAAARSLRRPRAAGASAAALELAPGRSRASFRASRSIAAAGDSVAVAVTTIARSRQRGAAPVSASGSAFSFQLVDVVPMGALDRRVDGVVTEAGIVRVAPAPRDPSRDPG